MRFIERVKSLLRSEDGNATASIAMAIICTMIGSGIVIVIASMAQTSISMGKNVAMSTAITSRLDEFVSVLNSTGEADDTEKCYDGICVTPTTSDIAGGQKRVRLEAVNGTKELTKNTTLSPVGGTHISGFDDQGNPVWVTKEYEVPKRLTGTISLATQVDATTSGSTSCALDQDKHAWCWGYNSDGQVGDGTTTSRNTPVRVAGEHTFTQLFGRDATVCGIRTDSKAYCWGDNQFGLVGNNGTDDALVPTAVAGDRDFTAIAFGGAERLAGPGASRHVCAIDTTQAAWCWGSSSSGQLGSVAAPDGAPSRTPTKVSGSTTFSSLTLGAAHTCGLATNQTVWCWGINDSGQLGTGSLEPASVSAPAQVMSASTFTSVTTSRKTTCALTTVSAVECWGDNTSGAAGVGTTEANRPTPSAIPGMYKSVEVAGPSACALDLTDKAWCWGDNTLGALGIGSTAASATSPTAVAGDHQFRTLRSAFGNVRCGINLVGQLWCFGAGTAGQLGDGSSTAGNPAPVQRPGGKSYTAVVVGFDGVITETDTGELEYTGTNTNGESGSGTADPSPSPRTVKSPTDVHAFPQYTSIYR